MHTVFHLSNLCVTDVLPGKGEILETTQESLPDTSVAVEPIAVAPRTSVPAPARLSLPPKGACWYCDKPLDSVKRFCGKSCADSFDEEAEYTR
jgi:hypothetical protein